MPVFLAVALADTSTLAGGEVYKVIGADGRITYSARPPVDPVDEQVETIRLDPGPSPSEHMDAKRRLQQMERQANRERDQLRVRQAEREAAAAAARDVEQARLELQRAQRKLESDGRALASGGLLASPEERAGLQRAEQRLRDALEAASRLSPASP